MYTKRTERECAREDVSTGGALAAKFFGCQIVCVSKV